MEKVLIQAVQKKDKRAFEELYEKYSSYALRTAYLVTKSHSLASDAVQETFIRVYFSIDLFDINKPFKSWLYKILINECCRLMKKNANTVYLEDFPVFLEKEKHYDNLDTERYELLYKSIRRLNDKIRIPMVLKYLRGFKEKEIADILDININTLKSRLFNGRQKIKEYIEENCEGGSFNEYQS